jgi:DNA replication protein DnaC
MSPTKVCNVCGGSGWKPVERDGLRAVESCSCRTQPRTEQWWMQRAAIPKRYHHCDFADFNTLNDTLSYAKIKARGFADNYPFVREGLLLLGNPGVGKTHLAIAILKQLMTQKGVETLFCSYQELLQRIRESYDPVSSSTEAAVLDPILNTEVVVIDDLGANRVSEWVEDTITYVLNHRYNEKKATILTSNLPDSPDDAKERTPGGKYRIAETLGDRIGLRVRSRLYEMCEIVSIHADDFRQTVRAHQE